MPRAVSLEDGLEHDKLYTADTAVAGWKRYWHHADAAANWQAVRGRYDRSKHGGQNISITGWIGPGSTFSATLEVVNLNDLELGALLWLLTLEDGACHRLGYGKPLGFGSVHIKVPQGGLHVAKGAGWRTYWSSLSSEQPPAADDEEVRGLATSFTNVADGCELKAALDAFLALATGKPDVPVLYPRVYEVDANGKKKLQGQDELFKWFVENERGSKHALPAVAAEDPSLPFLEARTKSATKQTGQRRPRTGGAQQNRQHRQNQQNQQSSGGGPNRQGGRTGNPGNTGR
jgi:hypothetical protein